MNAVATAVVEMTVPQKILLAASRLEDKGDTPFSAEALIVGSWQANPRTFGLKGVAELYPDSNRVLACIMGEKGLARRGWLLKVGKKLYSLSRQGRDEVARLLDGGAAPAPKRRSLPARVKVSRGLEERLVALFTATAVRRFKEGLKREISFRDACRFWGLTEEMRGEAVDEALNKVPATLTEVEKLFIGETVELSNGQIVSETDLKSITAVHDFLADQFGRHLRLQRERHKRF